MSGELIKMKIEAFETDNYSGDPTGIFTVMFNPNSYTSQYNVDYFKRLACGDTGSPQIFNTVQPREYSFEFLFDGTGTAAVWTDVQEAINTFFNVTNYEGKIRRPKYLILNWGTLVSRCVLKSAETTYTLFKPDGSPLRAKIKAVFWEKIEDRLRTKEERKSLSDLSHVKVVREGESLSQLCQEMYGTPDYYQQVAEYNELTNFRKLEAGQALMFPPVKTLEEQS